MLFQHQPHLDPHPPGVQGSWAGLQPNLCLWDTQGQGQGAQRLKDHCLLCVHPCGFCHCPHTHNLAASKQTNCSLCSNWSCLPAYSNSTASNYLCPKGNFFNSCYVSICMVSAVCSIYNTCIILPLTLYFALGFITEMSAWIHNHVLLHILTNVHKWVTETQIPFTATYPCTAYRCTHCTRTLVGKLTWTSPISQPIWVGHSTEATR